MFTIVLQYFTQMIYRLNQRNTLPAHQVVIIFRAMISSNPLTFISVVILAVVENKLTVHYRITVLVFNNLWQIGKPFIQFRNLSYIFHIVFQFSFCNKDNKNYSHTQIPALTHEVKQTELPNTRFQSNLIVISAPIGIPI